ncbi:ATP-grasp domain-containing protein [Streptomonospora sp. S1-112]|uniref:ATP-grasp domain-containing protein n=1 Tax=Streptomonospora mangrovi TaxID=2883123 RepID=A0A9X3SI96_9ACTN|nr:ATP-grasp domain-containing protein [Streptomonospora mangrovi]MDA0566024.1 ATP-grasp domain-containing protein [Streptomonospora mangrovi]
MDTSEHKNVFVVGLDDKNRETLAHVPDAARLRFHGLLDPGELQEGEVDIEALLDKARSQLDSFDGSIDAIVGYWDFPVSMLVPILTAEYGLPGTSLESVVKCEHKYWSRLEQSKVISELPRFALVDLEGPARPPEGLEFPMWLKPVKSFSSDLAFRVEDEKEFTEAVDRIREGIGRIGRPFESILSRLDLPPEVAEAGGQACLAEEALRGVQVAVEGYVHNGEVVVYGVLDSVDYPGSPVFLRHQYPSVLDDDVVARLDDISRRVITQVGLDSATYSIEFFYDPLTGDINLLEINARHSQSHAELFEYVDGLPNHDFMISLGLGREPRMPENRGRYPLAAKWYYRRFTDARVVAVPDQEEIDRLTAEIPGLKIKVVPRPGQRLSDMIDQDSYSFELAHLFIGAEDETALRAKYERCVEELTFEFDHIEAPGS